MSKRLVVIDGVRTPFVKFGTDFADLAADELGRSVVSALLTKTGVDPELIDEVVFGCVGQPPESANVARVLALRAGIPQHVPAVTVHRNCASGMEAITQAYERMCAGVGDLFVVGGAESMSQVPFFFTRAAQKKFTMLQRSKSLGQKVGGMTAFRLADFSPRVGLQMGLTDPVSGLNMGQTAEVLAREWNVTREEQDEFSMHSHHKVAAGRERLAEEIAPVYVRDKFKKAVDQDNGVRENQSMEALGKLRPVFEKKYGSVTAGNSSQITDGAVALLVATEEKAAQLGLEPLGTMVGYAYSGCDPKRMGLGPVWATHKAEQRSGLRVEDADLIEINEAFAAQVLAVVRAMASHDYAKKLGRDRPVGEVDMSKLNVNGGAVALGHPVGATGARMVLTALKELKRRDARRALTTLCVGGGQGASIWLERA